MVNKDRHSSDSPALFQLVLLLGCLTIINIFVFYGFGSSSTSPQSLRCPTDTILQVTALYLANNGLFWFDKFLPSECSKHTERVENALAQSVRDLVNECRFQETLIKQRNMKHPLITLFTTHAAHNHKDAEKLMVHTNTLTNWASFKPKVKLVLFSNDSTWTETAKTKGWDVIDSLEKETPPILKDMFDIVMNRYNTNWYGYVNADILFTTDFITTLEAVTHKYNTSNTSIMLTGRRTNIDNLTALNVSSDDSLRISAKMHGHLYRQDAEDFFITTKSFPWKRVIPVVIGRPGYDNWLVAEARCRLNTTVIEITDSVTAVHQTTKKGGNAEGHTHKNSLINIDMFKHYNITPNFIAGLTQCIEHRTYRTFCNTIGVGLKAEIETGCKCKGK